MGPSISSFCIPLCLSLIVFVTYQVFEAYAEFEEQSITKKMEETSDENAPGQFNHFCLYFSLPPLLENSHTQGDVLLLPKTGLVPPPPLASREEEERREALSSSPRACLG